MPRDVVSVIMLAFSTFLILTVACTGAAIRIRYVDKIAKQIAGTVSDILSKKDEKKSQDSAFNLVRQQTAVSFLGRMAVVSC